MSLFVQPARSEEGWVWTLGEITLTAGPVGRGWRYTRTGIDAPATLDGEGDDAPLSVVLRLGEGPHVAYLDPPTLLLPGESRVLWLAWPLEIAAMRGDIESDVFRPGLRHTLIGAVDGGRVMDAVRCPVIDGPGAEEVGLATGRAALRVGATSHADRAVTLRRFPVAPAGLALYRDGDHLVAGDVDIEIHEGNRAAARSAAGDPPEPYELVAAPTTDAPQRGGLSLGWLLEATRRSTEFSL